MTVEVVQRTRMRLAGRNVAVHCHLSPRRRDQEAVHPVRLALLLLPGGFATITGSPMSYHVRVM